MTSFQFVFTQVIKSEHSASAGFLNRQWWQWWASAKEWGDTCFVL